MRVLLDTGVLLRSFDRNSPERSAIHQAIRRLWTDRHEIVTSAQNIAEFWNVSTRPVMARGGYGHAPSLVEARVRHIERIARVLPFSARAYEQWRRLVVDHQIQGVAVHDARIVATMIAENVDQLITLNIQDFRRYPGIVVLTPGNVI